VTPGQRVPVVLYWRLRETTGTDYFTFMELRCDEINRRGGQDDIFSGIYRWFYPTPMWRAGEIVPEVRWLTAFPDLPPGGYRLALRVHHFPGPEYPAFRYSARARERDGWLIAGATFYRPDPVATPGPAARTVDAALGGLVRLTHAEQSPALADLQPGEALTVRLFWETLVPPNEDYSLFLHLYDGTGERVAQRDTALHETGFPTSTWYAGARVVTTHRLDVPPDAVGPFSLRLGMYFWATGARLPATQAGTPLPDDQISLGPP
jgi:hypothetical protein